MADKKFSELETASEIKNNDFMAISQDTGNGKVSLKATILAIATKILTAINFTSALQTTDKTVIGAINEVAQGGGGGGSSTLDGLNDVDIDDTTLADGQALVYDGIEEKWVNGQGGGGTGGHTIIDENGNSMTARAGLQFVGANVSDDATNDKTIVDLASAGGIDGVFPDFDNAIVVQTNVPSSDIASWSYTATEDCVIYISIQNAAGQSAQIRIDGKNVAQASGSYAYRATAFTVLKKGQVVTVTGNVNTGTNTQYAVYGIQTGTTHSKFQPVIFSLEEREIGVWTDGKPLYVRTYNVTFSSNYTDVTIDTTHEVKLLDGGIDSNNYDNFIHLGYGTSQNDMCGAYEYEAGKIRFQNFYYSSRPNGWLNVYYTKSTDVAGSGSWTPQGVPAVHYSTEEHIVGTWTDGKTLWEKAIEFGALPDTTTKNVAHNIASVDKIWVYDGFVYGNSGQTFQLNRTTNAFTYQWETTVDRTNVSIQDFANFSNDFSAVVVVRYTKTS